MPIYEYVCTSCGKEFEAIQKFSDEPLTDCECGDAGSVHRKLSLAAFQLKGGGWFKDMYGGSNGNGSNGKSSNGNGASAGSSGDGAGKDSGSGSSESAAPAAHACGGACSCG